MSKTEVVVIPEETKEAIRKRYLYGWIDEETGKHITKPRLGKVLEKWFPEADYPQVRERCNKEQWDAKRNLLLNAPEIPDSYGKKGTVEDLEHEQLKRLRWLMALYEKAMVEDKIEYRAADYLKMMQMERDITTGKDLVETENRHAELLVGIIVKRKIPAAIDAEFEVLDGSFDKDETA